MSRMTNAERIKVLEDTRKRIGDSTQLAGLRECAEKNHRNWQSEAATHPSSGTQYKVSVIRQDWGVAAGELAKRTGQIPAVLNMANAQAPGGSYKDGSAAQEENLARRSTLCGVFDALGDYYGTEMSDLINGKRDTVPFTPNQICFKGPEDSAYTMLSDDQTFLFHELRCAATPSSSFHFDAEGMRKKIVAQLETLIKNNCRHVVLSAFGCGIYNNPADRVAKLYKDEIETRQAHFDEIVFAIYYAGYGKDNAPAFEAAFAPQPSETQTLRDTLGNLSLSVENTGASQFFKHPTKRDAESSTEEATSVKP